MLLPLTAVVKRVTHFARSLKQHAVFIRLHFHLIWRFLEHDISYVRTMRAFPIMWPRLRTDDDIYHNAVFVLCPRLSVVFYGVLVLDRK